VIVQWILDFARDLISFWIDAFPGLPEGFYDAQGWLITGGLWLNDQVSAYGALIPFNTINTLLGVWVGILTFWLVCVGIRVVLWAIGR
jgi:hypothetical protein